MASDDVVVSVSDLTVDFPGRGAPVRAVEHVSFELTAGRALAVVGESGSGKSTMVSTLLGLHRETDAVVGGRVLVLGTDLGQATDREVRSLRGSGIAMIFQDPLSALDPYFSVGAQIVEVYRAHTGASRPTAWARAVEVLDRVRLPRPERVADAYPHELSGGMRQRALLAMALACRPRILVADEPTTSLDVTVQAQVLDLITELRRDTGMALILVTHNLGLTPGNVDQVMVMRAGRCVEFAATREVLTAARHPYTRELVAAVPRLDEPAPESRPAAGDPLVEMVDVRKEFRGRSRFGVRPRRVVAVDDVCLDVLPGTAVGIVGESGSGKTTLARMMVRLLRPSAGRVVFTGTEPDWPSGTRQMVFQDPTSSLNPRRTIGSSIGAPLMAEDRRARERRVLELLELVGLDTDWGVRYPHELSGGQRQRVAIARAIARRPRLLVCDEPVSSLDVPTQARVLRLLADLRRELDLTVVFIAHDLAVVRQVCDRIAVMRDGVIVESGTIDQIYDAPTHRYTRALLAAVPVLDLDAAQRKRAEREAVP